ncbi:MAG: aspartate carbamoyltransferase [Clostridiales bacterium]|nr:aspartate carbamoyltransferase [Clostridiales bacterium]
MRSVIDTLDLTVEEINKMMDIAIDIDTHPRKYAKSCEGKKMATLFFEPSTRTRLSHEAAMLELGGSVLGLTGAQNSSAVKGESVADTVKTVSCYADIIAIRHSLEGAALVASENASIPVINAGDGGHNHPTQTLADLLTIYREKGKLSGLTIGMCGDLKYGRTVHSLINAMTRYEGNRFVCISPDELKIPEYTEQVFKEAGIEYEITDNLEKALPGLDILYMTRIQRERFDNPQLYDKLKDSYSLTVDKMEHAKQDMIVMHPLPRVNEISVKVDDDPRACYFKQCLNGKLMRMSLIIKLLDEAKVPTKEKNSRNRKIYSGGHCHNLKCITHIEQELESQFYIDDDGDKRCRYCDTEMIREP